MRADLSPEVFPSVVRAEEILEERGYSPLFIGIKGSVVYDLPGTHKDVDVRAVYIAPTRDILRLQPGRQLIEVTEGRLDFVGWEVGKFLNHILKHNGNMVELLLTPPEFSVDFKPHSVFLRRLGEQLVTRKLYHYYRGYAHGQFKRAQSQIKTGKGAIYTYREMYAGIWLLLMGDLIFPWATLRKKIEKAGVYQSVLLDEFNMDRERITESILSRMRLEFDDLDKLLDMAFENSPLPETFDGWKMADEWLSFMRLESGVGGIPPV